MPVWYRSEEGKPMFHFDDMEEDDLARAREEHRTVFIFFLAADGRPRPDWLGDFISKEAARAKELVLDREGIQTVDDGLGRLWVAEEDSERVNRLLSDWYGGKFPLVPGPGAEFCRKGFISEPALRK